MMTELNIDSPELATRKSRMDYYMAEFNRCYERLYSLASVQHSTEYGCSARQHQQLPLGEREYSSQEHHALVKCYHAWRIHQSFVVRTVSSIKLAFLRLFHDQTIH